MIIANFGNEKEKYVSGLWQYNYGQVLRIQGLNLPTAVEIHFGLQETGGTTVTRIGTTKDGVTDVVIPDSMLENGDIDRNYMIYVFVYLSDEKSGETIRRITMKVDARSKPEAFDRPEDAELFREAIKAVNESAARSSESEKQAERWAIGRVDVPESVTDNAKYYSEESKKNAQQTTKDKEAVTDLVKQTSSIGQQVEEVKLNTQKAVESAKNAKASESNASTSEANAKQSEINASASEVNAKKYEQSTEIAKQAVDKSKQAVDETVARFNQSVTDASQTLKSEKDAHLQAITNAGTSETKKVADEGVKQVESVQAAGTTETGKVTTEGAKQVGLVKTEGEKHLATVQQAAQEIIADREQIAKNTTDIADLRQGKADAIVEAATGETIKTDISSDLKLVDLKVFGKSEQVQTTGANLFDDKQLLDEANKNYDKTLSGTGLWWFKIPASETVTVSTRNKKVTSNEYLVVSDVIGHESGGNIVWLSHPSAKLYDSATITPIDGNVWLGVNTNIQTIKTMLENVGGIMLNTGSVAKPFEPYTGGKPSPSPEYLQQIKSAGDKGSINIDVTGKNLIDEKNIYKTNVNWFIENKRFGGKGFNLKKGIPYTFSTDDTVSGLYINDYDTDETIIKAYEKQQLTYAPADDTRVTLLIFTRSGIKDDMKVQLEVGSTATSYEPYKELQTITLTCERPITKWDSVEKREGIWGIARQSGREILDGTEDWYHYTGYINDTLRCYCIDSLKAEDGFQKSLCSHFKNINNSWMSEIGNYGDYSDHSKLKNKYFVSDKATLEDFKAWLVQQKEAGTPVELVYKTTEETWEPLPEEMQLTLNALHTNYPTTIVTNSEDTEMQLTYVADTKNYYLSREQTIQKQILEIQNALISQKISGGGIIQVKDSAKLPIQNLRIIGKSEQVKTSGKNLIPHIRMPDKTENGITWTYKAEGIYHVKGTSTIFFDSPLIDMTNVELPAGKYRMIKSEKARPQIVVRLNSTGTNIHYTDEFTLEKGDKLQYWYCSISSGTTVDTDVYVYLEKDTGSRPMAQDFEPYTGGKPSPSPEYPQEIVSKKISEIRISGNDNQEQHVVLSEPITLRGIPISNNGNIMIDGKQYISDVICEKDGVIGVERYTKEITANVSEMNNTETAAGWKGFGFTHNIKPGGKSLINCLAANKVGINSKYDILFFNQTNTNLTQSQWKDKYPELMVNIVVELISPIFEPLQQADQEAIKKLHTYYPNTAINTGTWTEVEYTVDTKTYVDTKIAEVSTAIVQKGIE